jgi:hypothetical protein
MRRVASVLALASILVVVAAGCGGGQSEEEKWAGNVCTDISNWQSQVKKSTDNIQAALQSPGTGTLATINSEIQKAVNATSQLAANLKALNPPNTDEGAQAKQQLDALGTQVEKTTTQAKQTIQSVPEGASTSETIKKLSPLAPALQSLATNTSNTLAAVKASGEKIKEGFDKADSCKQFRD